MKNTTNNTTSAAALDRAAILRAAHDMTWKARETWPGIDYRATLAAALREAWTDARTGAAQQAQQQPQQPQPETLAEFYAAPGEVQYEMLRSAAAKVPSRASKKTRPITGPDGEPVIDPRTGKALREFVPMPRWVRWMMPESEGGLELCPWGEALDTIAAEAYTGLERINPDLPIHVILARATDYAAERLARMYQQKPAKGRAADSLDTLEDPDYFGGASYASPEAAALERDAIRSYCRSAEDLAAVKMAAAGYNHIETAGGVRRMTRADLAAAAVLDLDPETIRSGLGVTRQAVEKRLDKIARRRSEDRQTVEAWLRGDDLEKPQPRQRPREWRPDNASSAPGSR